MNHLLLALTVALALAWLGPALDDHSTEQAIADDLEQAAREEHRQERIAQAARKTCGENAGLIWLDDTNFRCATKRGFALSTRGVL